MTLTLHLSIIKFRPEGTQTGFNRNELEPDPFSSLLQGYEISTFPRLDPRNRKFFPYQFRQARESTDL